MKDWIKAILYQLLLVVLLVAVFLSGYNWKDSTFDNIVKDCDEWCFHFQNGTAESVVGITVEKECICSNGNVGWFEE